MTTTLTKRTAKAPFMAECEGNASSATTTTAFDGLSPSLFAGQDDVIRAEARLLSLYVRAPYRREYVALSTGDVVNTVVLGDARHDEQQAPPPPRQRKPVLVMAHGWGAGLGFFAKNLDALARHFRVYCFDWVGSGGSSRPEFDRRMSAPQSEAFFVDRFDEWRERVGIGDEKFVFMGHSLGGYLAAAYALRNPERVRGLVLVSPFGLPPRERRSSQRRQAEADRAMEDAPLEAEAASTAAHSPPSAAEETDASPPPPVPPAPPAAASMEQLPLKYRLVRRLFRAAWRMNVTPQRFLRFTSTFSDSFGRSLTERYVERRFSAFAGDEDGKRAFADYLYSISSAPGSAEFVIQTLMHPGAWARTPLIERLPRELSRAVPVVFVYGAHDWMNPRHAAELIEMARGHGHARMRLLLVPDSGHYSILERPGEFNRTAVEACHYLLEYEAEN